MNELVEYWMEKTALSPGLKFRAFQKALKDAGPASERIGFIQNSMNNMAGAMKKIEPLPPRNSTLGNADYWRAVKSRGANVPDAAAQAQALASFRDLQHQKRVNRAFDDNDIPRIGKLREGFESLYGRSPFYKD